MVDLVSEFPPPYFPWREFADGKRYLAVQGRDYPGETQRFRKTAHHWAAKHGYRCITRVGAKSVEFRIWKGPDPKIMGPVNVPIRQVDVYIYCTAYRAIVAKPTHDELDCDALHSPVYVDADIAPSDTSRGVTR